MNHILLNKLIIKQSVTTIIYYSESLVKLICNIKPLLGIIFLLNLELHPSIHSTRI